MTDVAVAGSMKNASASSAAQIGGAALDQGACCESAIAFSTFIGTLKVPAAPFTDLDSTASIAGVTMNAWACPAITGGEWLAGGGAQLWASDAAVDASTTIWTSWWCSNGLYKTITANATV
jgi:hypothetical protein